MANADPNISQMELRVLAMADQLAVKDVSTQAYKYEMQLIQSVNAAIVRTCRLRDADVLHCLSGHAGEHRAAHG